MITRITRENGSLKEKISELQDEIQKSMSKTVNINKSIEFDIRTGNVTDGVGNLKREVDMVLKQQESIENEIKQLTEGVRELNELAYNLDSTLKATVRDIQSVKSVPKEFLVEFQKFQEDVYGVWDRIYDIVIAD